MLLQTNFTDIIFCQIIFTETKGIIMTYAVKNGSTGDKNGEMENTSLIIPYQDE